MPISPMEGFIVKRFFSLLVALVLLVSMFALPTLALAEEATTPDAGADETESARLLGFSAEKFAELVIAHNKGLYVEMGSEFTLNHTWTVLNGEGDDAEEVEFDWLTDVETVKALFPGINFQLLPDERDDDEIGDDEEQYTITYNKGAHAAKDEDADNDSEAAEEAAVTASYYSGKHVTLKAATTFEAEEGWEFIGWLVPVAYDGGAVEGDNAVVIDGNKYFLYRAGDQFVMPAHNVEVTAYWYPVESDDDADEAAATAEEAKLEFAYPLNDIICLEYCTPSDDPKDEHWTRVAADDTIKLETAGWWMFRYVVIDGENGDVTDDDAVITPYNDKDFQNALLNDGVYNWAAFTVKRYAVDTTHPEIALSESMKTKMEQGLTVGTSYTVSTSLTITDSSSTTVTYKVYRHSGDGAATADADGWVLIYDSTAENKVLEAGTDYIASNGAITPLASDVITVEGNYRYKIVYSVKDANGYFGVEADAEGEAVEFHPTLLLSVHLSTEDVATQKKVEAWKIVLYVIAGLSAVGIVVLLLVKPKQAQAGDARVADSSADNGAAEASPDEQTEDKQ